MVFAIQSLKVNNLLAKPERQQRFVLVDRICHWRFGIGLATYGLIEVLAREVVESFAQRPDSLC